MKSIINLNNSVNEHIEESVNSYLNELDTVFGGVISRYNSIKKDGYCTYSDISVDEKDNEINNYIYTKTFNLNDREIELNMTVTDDFATINVFEAVERDDFSYNEITIDIFRSNNQLIMYAIKNSRKNNEGIRIGFDKVDLLPELCDHYDIDYKGFKIKNDSLINGIDIFNKKKSNKILKIKK